jgi:hypothetical protein
MNRYPPLTKKSVVDYLTRDFWRDEHWPARRQAAYYRLLKEVLATTDPATPPYVAPPLMKSAA